MHVKGRKGTPSLVDSIVCVILDKQAQGESSVSLGVIHHAVEEKLGYTVSSSSIRAAIYKSSGIFSLDKKIGRRAFYTLAASLEDDEL